eukprot:scaffold60533_cov15-Prasinocladus_malaysianus.AAC.1
MSALCQCILTHRSVLHSLQVSLDGLKLGFSVPIVKHNRFLMLLCKATTRRPMYLGTSCLRIVRTLAGCAGHSLPPPPSAAQISQQLVSTLSN